MPGYTKAQKFINEGVVKSTVLEEFTDVILYMTIYDL